MLVVSTGSALWLPSSLLVRFLFQMIHHSSPPRYCTETIKCIGLCRKSGHYYLACTASTFYFFLPAFVPLDLGIFNLFDSTFLTDCVAPTEEIFTLNGNQPSSSARNGSHGSLSESSSIFSKKKKKSGSKNISGQKIMQCFPYFCGGLSQYQHFDHSWSII